MWHNAGSFEIYIPVSSSPLTLLCALILPMMTRIIWPLWRTTVAFHAQLLFYLLLGRHLSFSLWRSPLLQFQSVLSDGVNFWGEHEILSTFLNSSTGPGVGVRPELVHSGRLSERDFISSRFYFLLSWQNERVGFVEATSLVWKTPEKEANVKENKKETCRQADASYIIV